MANLPKLNTLLAVPIIATQLIFILYIAVVANNHIKNYSAYPKFNLAVIATLIILTISCLIQTYRSNPGRVTTDIIEQLKLSLQAFPNQEEEEENEDAVNRIQIKEFNKQLLSLMNSKESSNTSITLDAES